VLCCTVLKTERWHLAKDEVGLILHRDYQSSGRSVLGKSLLFGISSSYLHRFYMSMSIDIFLRHAVLPLLDNNSICAVTSQN